MTVCSLDHVLQAIDTLPRLPQTTMKLVQVVNNPRSTIRQIVELIRYDQTVTAELLKLCNSAYVGLVRKITSLDDAVRYLGTSKVLQLLVTAHSRALLARPQQGYGLEPGMLWRHSVAVALCSQIIAKRRSHTATATVFTAGLLHDVGKVLLNEYVGREYTEIASCVRESKVSFCDAERRVLGLTHAEVGAAVAERWGLGDALVTCIRAHHEPDALDSPVPAVDFVHIADAITMSLGVGCGVDGLQYNVSAAVLERNGMEAAEIDEIGVETISELRNVESLFSDGA